MITSAMNTKFGIFSSEQRFAQTKNTIKSIKQRVPDAELIFLEMAGLPLTIEQKNDLEKQVDHIIDYTHNSHVIDLYNSTDNWDVVKNVNEVTCFAQALRTLVKENRLAKSKRIFKISGRYTLNHNFDIDLYNKQELADKFIVTRIKNSQFNPNITGGIVHQYMSRLWSWPENRTGEVIAVYDNMLNLMFERLQHGGYIDIEHGLFKFLNPDLVHQVDRIGIQGNIGPNGVKVSD